MQHHHWLVCAGLAAALAGCAAPGEDLGSAEQATFIGDLGVAMGSTVVTGSTFGASLGSNRPCAPSTAPVVVYSWTSQADANYTVTTAGSNFDTVLEIRRGDGFLLGCNDDSNGTLQSSVSFLLPASSYVNIIVSGYGAAAGSYRIGITGMPLSPLLWLRADTGITAPGNLVSQWDDQRGNGSSATMPTAGRQPLYVPSGVNGKPLIRFQGAQSLTLSPFLTPIEYSVFVAGKNSNPGESLSMVLGPGGNTPNNQLRWNGTTQVLVVGEGNGMPNTGGTMGNTRLWHVLSTVYDGADMTIYANGGAIGSSSFTATAPWALASIGSFYSSNFLQGDLAEIVAFARPLNVYEQKVVNVYLRSKYAIP